MQLIWKLKKKKKIVYFKKSLSIAYSKCGQEYEKIFKKEESIEILKILGLITNIGKHQKIYNHVRRKYKLKI